MELDAYAYAPQISGLCEDIRIIFTEYKRPCVIWKPILSRDGDHWCALYGPNLQEGVAGFGKTPEQAMIAFDIAWLNDQSIKKEV